MDVREQITALREQLRYHNEKYYNCLLYTSDAADDQ